MNRPAQETNKEGLSRAQGKRRSQGGEIDRHPCADALSPVRGHLRSRGLAAGGSLGRGLLRLLAENFRRQLIAGGFVSSCFFDSYAAFGGDAIPLLPHRNKLHGDIQRGR